MSQHYHFTLGPVQGFVSQARRTRDFWAGSFILSWLAAVAMKAVQAQQGVIRFPIPDEEFMKAMTRGGKGPRQGGIPNRFVADVQPGFDAAVIVESVNAAWRALADTVYNNDLKGRDNPETREIWDRQIKGFWEMSWAVTDDMQATNLLDRRKNWRTHLPPDEPGLKCMMMEGRQELSGSPGPGDGEAKHFWKEVRTRGGGSMKTDLRPDEHLCAIAFVKRRFARWFAHFSTSLPNGVVLKGWKLPTGVPSVAYMAAAPWLAQALERADDALLHDFHDAAYELTDSYGEWDTNIACVSKADGPKRWKALDGNVFFENFLDNKNIYDNEAQPQAQEVKKQLRALDKSAGLGPVSPFYALLLMDGDSLGANMSDATKQQKITEGLDRFTREAGNIVYRHNGFLIYAGGDDVLALVTLESALPCANELHLHYDACFKDTGVITSLSGAIEYAHIKMPLGRVLHDAHDLLANVAKDGRGRDAIAVRVWKPGGLALEWAMPWGRAVQDGQVMINKLAKDFSDDDEERQFSSKFFYRIRERFEVLNPGKDEQPLFNEDQAATLLAAEYLNSGAARTKELDQARTIVKPLLTQCQPVKRTAPGKYSEPKRIEVGGALLVRFLAHKGVER